MTGPREEKIRLIVSRALGIDAAAREAFIEAACQNEPDVLQGVRELLARSISGTEIAPAWAIGQSSADDSHEKDRRFASGQVVDDRFKILGFIDEGGMGEVYAALDLNLQQTIALKTIRSSIANRPGVIDHFKTEVKQSLRITHPNVCRVHQLASHEDGPSPPIWFLTMELLEGKTLARYLAGHGPMRFDRAFALIKQMVSALACAHELGIVHRDLKPSNVMIVRPDSKDERVVITDFGLAVSMSRKNPADRAGTPAYMAPEQVTGTGVGPQTDVFALGLIICEMLSGTRPTFDLSSAVNFARQRNEWLSSQSQLDRRIRPIINRCLRYRPEDRFKSAREILTLLEGDKRRVKAERLIAALAVAGALSAYAYVIIRSPVDNVVGFVQLTPDTIISGRPSLSPNGKYLAYMSNRADAENLDIWFQTVPGTNSRRVTRDPGEDNDPSVSPNGNLIAFRSEHSGGGIYLIRSDGTGERLLVQGGRNPAFSPDGRSIAYWLGSEDSFSSGALYTYSLPTGVSRRLAANFADARDPTWDSEGQSLLFYGCPSANDKSGACPDWWSIHNGGEPVPTGLVPLLDREKIEPDFPPKVTWQGKHLLLSGRRGHRFQIWDVLIPGDSPHAAGRPVPVTSGDTQERDPVLGQKGVFALLHVMGTLPLWRVPEPVAGGASKPEKLTEGMGLDCCPSAPRNSRWLFFTRRVTKVWELMKLDLPSGNESTVYSSSQDKFWPLADSTGNTVVFESKGQDGPSIFLWKDNVARLLCRACFHPSAWLSDGKEFLYSTVKGDLASFDIQSAQSHIILPANRDYSLGDPDWVNDYLLFTVLRQGSKQAFAVRLPHQSGQITGPWIPLTSPPENVSLPRWSQDGSAFFYLSRSDGFYCIWGARFDSVKRSAGPAFPVKHYHDLRASPSRTFSYLLRMSDRNHWLYINVGELTSTLWIGHLERNSVATFLRGLFGLN